MMIEPNAYYGHDKSYGFHCCRSSACAIWSKRTRIPMDAAAFPLQTNIKERVNI